jgi:hypothetical protein
VVANCFLVWRVGDAGRRVADTKWNKWQKKGCSSRQNMFQQTKNVPADKTSIHLLNV